MPQVQPALNVPAVDQHMRAREADDARRATAGLGPRRRLRRRRGRAELVSAGTGP